MAPERYPNREKPVTDTGVLFIEGTIFEVMGSSRVFQIRGKERPAN